MFIVELLLMRPKAKLKTLKRKSCWKHKFKLLIDSDWFTLYTDSLFLCSTAKTCSSLARMNSPALICSMGSSSLSSIRSSGIKPLCSRRKILKTPLKLPVTTKPWVSIQHIELTSNSSEPSPREFSQRSLTPKTDIYANYLTDLDDKNFLLITKPSPVSSLVRDSRLGRRIFLSFSWYHVSFSLGFLWFIDTSDWLLIGLLEIWTSLEAVLDGEILEKF
mmetsp:Transcript_16821/g.30071  ORF Transcript_16821/g.30071 Transcript_16821/m.30071 type:complete len:219 (-) Transcript_16821:2608-3264(-)